MKACKADNFNLFRNVGKDMKQQKIFTANNDITEART